MKTTCIIITIRDQEYKNQPIWNKAFLEYLSHAELLNKYPAFYGISTIIYHAYKIQSLVTLISGVLISPSDLLPDVFCLMVRIFRLMLVLLYI
jgi:hypothetical protein